MGTVSQAVPRYTGARPAIPDRRSGRRGPPTPQRASQWRMGSPRPRALPGSRRRCQRRRLPVSRARTALPDEQRGGRELLVVLDLDAADRPCEKSGGEPVPDRGRTPRPSPRRPTLRCAQRERPGGDGARWSGAHGAGAGHWTRPAEGARSTGRAVSRELRQTPPTALSQNQMHTMATTHCAWASASSARTAATTPGPNCHQVLAATAYTTTVGVSAVRTATRAAGPGARSRVHRGPDGDEPGGRRQGVQQVGGQAHAHDPLALRARIAQDGQRDVAVGLPHR